MDDVRAVMDAAGVQRAALLGWGTGGAASALFFAATHPERTIAVCCDPLILGRRAAGYPWGSDPVDFERVQPEVIEGWGAEEPMAQYGFGERPELAPEDEDFTRWFAEFTRFSASPMAASAFTRVWFETDVQEVLPAVTAPTLVFFRTGATRQGGEEYARYLADRLVGAQLVGLPGAAVVVWLEDPEPLVAAIESFLGSVAEEEADFDRVLATVLFTVIAAGRNSSSGTTRPYEPFLRATVDRRSTRLATLLCVL